MAVPIQLLSKCGSHNPMLSILPPVIKFKSRTGEPEANDLGNAMAFDIGWPAGAACLSNVAFVCIGTTSKGSRKYTFYNVQLHEIADRSCWKFRIPCCSFAE